MAEISKDDVVIMKLTNGETIMATYVGYNTKLKEHVIKEPLNVTVIDNSRVSMISAGMWLPLLGKDSGNTRIPVAKKHTLTIVKGDEAINDYYEDSIKVVKEKRQAYTNPEYYEDIIDDSHKQDTGVNIPVQTSNTAVH